MLMLEELFSNKEKILKGQNLQLLVKLESGRNQSGKGRVQLKKKSGFFQIWSETPTHPCDPKNLGKKKNFYHSKMIFWQFWRF